MEVTPLPICTSCRLVHPKNSLEEIDIFTTSYEKEEDVVKYLVNANRLDSYDNELFIVSRSGDKYDYMENLYNDCPMKSEIIKLALVKEN